MIIVTGGAGFIGSCFLLRLNQEGIDDILVVDNLSSAPDKERNLNGKKFTDYLDKSDFLTLVQKNKLPKTDSVVHMGACSSTILTDEEYYMENNYEYSKTLAGWALNGKIPFLYASSAATYGDGAFGYSDSDENTRRLKPLNLYGFSKHIFDLWVLDNGLVDKVTGIKFFNVFGPNEYHKDQMKSVICKAFPEVKGEGKIKLFKSYNEEYGDGDQKRDFIYIKDAVEVMYYLFSNPAVTGIFNLGTGKARSWNDLAKAMFKALGKEPVIEYIDMPEALRERYQYFTEADMSKLYEAGCNHAFSSLEASVKDYIGYLKKKAYL